jgi:hypothetical protein
MSPIDNLIVFTTLLMFSGFIFKGILIYLEKHPTKKPEHEHKHKHI